MSLASRPWLILIATLLGAAALVAAVVGVYRVARGQRGEPARCPPGLVSMGARCCGQGQRLENGGCRGTPTRCAVTQRVTPDGCIASPSRIRYSGGTLRLGPSDWEAQGVVEPREIRVGPFELERVEVTLVRWRECVGVGTCRVLPQSEPGQAVGGVSGEEAERFCRSLGGRLPTGDEWLFAAAGREGRRFPWGQTGLVCRRAAFGLVSGPCGWGAEAPELAGARPDGATPEGALDLAGNVAEWTREAEGYVARGGSFRSAVAADLKSWAVAMPADRPAWAGFRCAYDVDERAP